MTVPDSPASAAPGTQGEAAGRVVFALAAALLVAAYLVGASARAAVWRDSGTLWRDVIDKLYERRVFDPSRPGVESPRCARARPYNNIGLHMYNEARAFIEAQAAAARHRAAGETALLAKAEADMAGVGERVLRYTPAEFRAPLLAAFRHALGRPEDAQAPDGTLSAEGFASAMRPILKEDPGNHPLLVALLAARECLFRALEHSPTYSIAHLNLGLVCRVQGRLDEAERHFRLAHTFNEDYLKAYRYHALVLHDMGEYREAFASAASAYRLNRDGEAAFLAAKCALAAAEYDTAESWFRRAADHGMASGDFWFHYALERLHRKDEHSALRMLERAAEGAPGSVQIYRLWSGVLARRGEMGKAEAVFIRLMRETGGSAVAHELLADFYLNRMRNRDLAALFLSTALQQHPRNPTLHLLSGQLAASGNQVDRARAHFRSALRLDPGQAEGWYRLALLDREADAVQARQDLRKALSLAPGVQAYRDLAADLGVTIQ